MTQVIVWPGWLAGALLGFYLLLQYWLTAKPLGCSTGYGNLLGLASRKSYFRSDPKNGWRLWLLLGLPLGGLLAALTSGQLQPSFQMGMYDQVLPRVLWLKGLFLVGGGVLIGYGARMAGGCQSGHSINGMAQLNPPSLLASAGFFVGGIIAVQGLFRIMS